MAQKPVLRGEVGCACVARVLRVRSVSREEVWASAGVQGAWVGACGCEVAANANELQHNIHKTQDKAKSGLISPNDTQAKYRTEQARLAARSKRDGNEQAWVVGRT